MAKKTVLITGGSGLIGCALTEYLLARNYSVRWLTRKVTPTNLAVEQFVWACNNDCVDSHALRDVAILIHLAGANIAEKRWTTARKREIIDSRCKSLKALANQYSRMGNWPKIVISASATGFYAGLPFDANFDEESPAGNSFTSEVCLAWEAALQPFNQNESRCVSIRTGIVLSPKGGALPKLKQITKFGLGAALGSGNQQFPWIDISDLCAAYLFAIENEEIHGSINAVAPQLVSNAGFMKTLAQSMHKPFFMPTVPAWLLRLLLGERAEILLEGAGVIPQVLLNHNFQYTHCKIEDALQCYTKIST